MDKEVLDWLLEGPDWLRYAVELQLLDTPPDVRPLLKDSAIAGIIRRLKDGEVGIPALKTGKVHYTEAGKAYWDLFFLADIGLNAARAGLDGLMEEIFRFQAADGTFTIPPNVKDNYFCMSAILLASLGRMGYRDDPRLMKYIRVALGAQLPGGGWDCYGDSLGYLESCPMDNLNLLMLLGQYGQYKDSPQLVSAIDLLLEHWVEGAHLYGFGVGRRFRSLQYPAVKYGILRVLDVLSLFPRAVESRSFRDMLDFVHGKAIGGRYVPEEAATAYADFDFGQTAQPSRWLTFLVSRIDKRVAECC
ncbi:MAG TPA: hypothetical protein VJ377_06870 [Dehalococcoidales bacterium]|nr:hypothetical protein [Dehalococcoidales bacterium]